MTTTTSFLSGLALSPLSAFVTAAVVLASAAGCQPDRGPGDLTVTFVLGNDRSCDDVGVEDIRVNLLRGRGDDRTVIHSETAPCSAGEVTIEDIDPRAYEIEVFGTDSARVDTFDNLGEPEADRRVEIFEASSVDVEVDLTARPAQLEVRWDFDFSSCSGSGIDRFQVRAFQEGGGTQLLESELDCDDGGAGYRLVDDPDRRLNGTLLGEVGIRPLDESGATIGDNIVFTFDPVGAGYPVRLTLECEDTGCSGSGTPD